MILLKKNLLSVSLLVCMRGLPRNFQGLIRAYDLTALRNFCLDLVAIGVLFFNGCVFINGCGLVIRNTIFHRAQPNVNKPYIYITKKNKHAYYCRLQT